MQFSVDCVLRSRLRRCALAILALALLGALVWRGPERSMAGSNAPPVYLPLIMRLPICFPTRGTYPIAVRDTYLNANGFVNPDGYYSDETYQNKTWKRIYLHDSVTNPSGGFGWLRWRADPMSTNIISYTASLTGTGNLGEGFDEVVPWPANSNLPKPAGYPQFPYKLNAGDWVYDNPNVTNSSSIRSALDYHTANKTIMVLPIFDATISSNGPIYHVARPGAFLLLGYSLNGTGYLDLVYIEEPDIAPCPG